MKIHFLDVGVSQYGDCLLVEDGATTILIDGSHKGDFRGSATYASIPDQIRKLLSTNDAPIPLSLLVVTHCHADHIGCLPEMVKNNVIAPKIALVADEHVGYGDSVQDSLFDGLPSDQAGLLLGLQEEPLFEAATDNEIEAFIADAADLRPSYVEMLETLTDRGTKVIRYHGRTSEITELERAFRVIGLKILGPSEAQLLLCARALEGASHDALVAVESLAAADYDLASAYRALTRGVAAADAILPAEVLDVVDQEGPGAAKNNQSIVLSVGKGRNKALLTGDMQFAKAEIPGLGEIMEDLLRAAVANGPYAFVKIPHHASYNAFDESVLAAFGPTRCFGISTGKNGAAHPNLKVLRLLRKSAAPLTWARTDKNKLFTVDITNGIVEFTISSGELSDAQPKPADALPILQQPAPPEPPALAPVAVPPVVQSLPRRPESFVEITARIPSTLSRVTITVDIAQPDQVESVDGPAPLPPAGFLADGRSLPKLVFVTDRERLTAKIGQEGYDRCTAMISDGGGKLLEIANRESPFAEIANKGRDMEGVVIVGDYDVVPGLTYDVLPADVRGHVSTQSDPDQFIVWSDQRYGDLDGDQLADVPVSRVPDCSSASFLLRGLSAADKRASSAKFGSRNARRPFAEGVFRNVPGSGAILVSGPQDHLDPRVRQPAGSRLYFMLHGSDSDATRYWGEDDEGMVEAFNLANLSPETAAAGATVLAGCCWGALAVRQLASRTSNHWNVTPHTPQSSIALRLIELGALAFVGCTGAHYSPLDGDLKFFGEPMHRAFWQSYAAGIAPAKALFEAKRAYIRDMPHGRQTMPEWAIEYKVLRQFTCLGLGW